MARPRLYNLIKSRYVAVLRGEGREFTVTLPEPVSNFTAGEVAGLRKRLRMTQTEFALLLNVSVKTIESWEGGTRRPSAAAARLLQVVENPDAFGQVVHAREEMAAA